MEFTVPQRMRAIDAARALFPESSRRTLQHWLQGGRFCLNGSPLQNEGDVLEPGQVIEARDAFHPQAAGPVKILYEDRYFIAIDKPAGLLSVPLDGPSTKRHALGSLRQHYRQDQIFAVHRIDRESSGVLIFARGFDSKKKFESLFENHDLTREYFAIVEGRMPQEAGTWECQLTQLPSYDVEMTEDPDSGKIAITHFTALRRSPKYTYLRVLLETGRKHQIRVHCKIAGFPILGDRRYGATEDPIGRLCLHARRIAFRHPFTRRALDFTSPLPPPFKKLGADDRLF